MEIFLNNKKKKAKINLTPLIDIIFLLVTFYMLTSKYGEYSGLNISINNKNIESSAISETSIKNEKIIGTYRFALNKDYKIWYQGNNYSKDKITNIIKDISKQDIDANIIINVQNGVPVQYLTDLMQIFINYRLNNIILEK